MSMKTGPEHGVMGMKIVLVGNPVDGFEFYGPFNNGNEAAEWADGNPIGADWWVAPLLPIDYEVEEPVDDGAYPLTDWQYAVANGDTELGYAAWVASNHERDAFEPTESDTKRAVAGYLLTNGDDEEDEEEVCPGCGAVEGTEAWGTVGDGFDGYCPSCADKREGSE